MAKLNERSIRIRPYETMYEGKGFLVTASNASSFQTRIFVRTREGAEVVRDALWLRAKADAAIDTVLKESR